jgi:hypothetical protein
MEEEDEEEEGECEEDDAFLGGVPSRATQEP